MIFCSLVIIDSDGVGAETISLKKFAVENALRWLNRHVCVEDQHHFEAATWEDGEIKYMKLTSVTAGTFVFVYKPE